MSDVPKHLTEAEMDRLAVKVVELLHGVPAGQALAILTARAPLVLNDGHVVDVTNPRFRALAERAAAR